MGTVFLAEDTRLGRDVAVKTVKSDHLEASQRDTVVARFRREARTAAATEHPNLPVVYDAGLDDEDDLYLVMEHIKGVSLDGPVDEGEPLPAVDVMAIGMQAAAALDALHSHGIVHRDVKPANLLLNEKGTVKVVDFGIATDTEGRTTRLTRTGFEPGTPEYQAPELLHGQRPEPRSDLYALGAVLYELATGAPLFAEAPSLYEVQRAHSETSPRRLDHPGLNALIANGLLRKSPSDRPATARDVYLRFRDLFTATDPAPETERLYGNPTLPLLIPSTPPTAVPMAPRILARNDGDRSAAADKAYREGDYRKALAEYRNLAEELEDTDPPAAFTARVRSVESLHRLGQAAVALQALESLVSQRRSQAPADESVLRAMLLYGRYLHSAGRTSEARRWHEATAAEAETLLGPGHPVTVEARNALAVPLPAGTPQDAHPPKARQ